MPRELAKEAARPLVVTPNVIAHRLTLRAFHSRGYRNEIRLTLIEMEGFLEAAAEMALKYCAPQPMKGTRVKTWPMRRTKQE